MAERPDSGDLREQHEPDEIKEFDLDLDADHDPAPAFFERPWFRYASFAMAGLVVISLLLPVLAIFFSGNGSNGDVTVAPPQVPVFELPAAAGGTVSLADVAERNSAVVIVFYRGFF